MKNLNLVSMAAVLFILGCGDSAGTGGNCSEAGPCVLDGGYDGMLGFGSPRLGFDGAAQDQAPAQDQVVDGEGLAQDAASDRQPAPLDVSSEDVGLPTDGVLRTEGDAQEVVAEASPDSAAPAPADAREVAPRVAYLDAEPAGATVFRDGVSYGLLSGQAIPVWGQTDTVTGPVCLPGDYVAGSERSCARYLSWGAGNALCLSGTVPAVPAAELGTSWGLGISVPVGGSGELGQDFGQVSATFAGVPTAAVKAGRFLLAVMVANADGTSKLYYHVDDGTGGSHSLLEFNTEWWAPEAGSYLTTAEVRHILAFYVIVASSSTDSFAVTNLCLVQVAFSPFKIVSSRG